MKDGRIEGEENVYVEYSVGESFVKMKLSSEIDAIFFLNTDK